MTAERGHDEHLPQLAERIIESYQETGTLCRLVEAASPSVDVVIKIAEELKHIVFPVCRLQDVLQPGDVPVHVRKLLAGLHERLARQIACALQTEACAPGQDGGKHAQDVDFEALGRKKSLQFLRILPVIRTALAADVQAAYDGDPAARSLDEVIFCYPGLEAVTIYRMAHELFRLEVPLIPRMMTEWAHHRTGIDIHAGARIGPFFFIDHGTGVVIGETCEIADHVKLYQGVTLGALSFPKDRDGKLVRGRKRHPTIEHDVVIYANATILGGDTVIGAHSVIGASVSLTKSVPPGTLVTIDKPSLRFRRAS